MNGYDRSALASGAVFVLLGLLFLFDRLDVIDLRPSVVWPALLIAIGVSLVIRSAPRRR